MSRLQEARRRNALKAFELAAAVGIHPTMLSNIEHRRYVARPDTRSKLAVLLEERENRLFESSGLARGVHWTSNKGR